jgi:hypothetical protein
VVVPVVPELVKVISTASFELMILCDLKNSIGKKGMSYTVWTFAGSIFKPAINSRYTIQFLAWYLNICKAASLNCCLSFMENTCCLFIRANINRD